MDGNTRRRLIHSKEATTIAKTLPDLRRQDAEMRNLGFVKTHRGAGFSEVTKDFYQHWRRAIPFNQIRWSARRDGLKPMNVD